jgi:YhcH/YjgK/YiaL family protein
MIVDMLANAGRYRGLSPLLDQGLEAMESLVTQPPADGRHELAGADLSASLSSYATDNPAAKEFEAHRRYIDIQVVLRGSETLYWAPLDAMKPQGEYSKADDIAFYEGPPSIAVPLEPEWFTVLFPQDAHKPGCLRGSPSRVRKLVIKVAV